MPIPPSPFVTFVFSGLLAITANFPNEPGQIGFQSKAPGHEINIIVYKIQNQSVIETVASLTFNHETIRKMADLWVDIEGTVPPKQQTVEKYISGDLSQPPSDKRDFRYIIDIEGRYFYNRELTLNRDVFKPRLFFSKGLFYSASLTEKDYQTTNLDSNGNPLLSSTYPRYRLGKIAATVGVNLYVDHPSQSVVIRKGRGGVELLRLVYEEDISYGIRIENRPKPDTPSGDHFIHYYDAISLFSWEPMIIPTQFGINSIFGMSGVCEAISLGRSKTLGN